VRPSASKDKLSARAIGRSERVVPPLRIRRAARPRCGRTSASRSTSAAMDSLVNMRQRAAEGSARSHEHNSWLADQHSRPSRPLQKTPPAWQRRLSTTRSR
jgi:hypothetical protein